MTDQEMIDQATGQDFLDALAHPDPDPDSLPELHAGSDLALQAETATRLLRAALRQEDTLAVLKERMANDLAAWQAMIGKAQLRSDTWRSLVKAWMLRTGTTQLKHPAFTASTTKGRTRIVVDSEDEALAVLKGLKGGERAIRVKESIIKAELDAIYNAIPSAFGKAVRTEDCEPGLMVRRAK